MVVSRIFVSLIYCFYLGLVILIKNFMLLFLILLHEIIDSIDILI
jgi:hypothetical protein